MSFWPQVVLWIAEGAGVLLLGILIGTRVGTQEERRRWEDGLVQRSPFDGILHSRATASRQRLQDEGRDDRLEQAIEAIAIEVERVAEGQRFVTKLLAERGQPLRDRLAQPKQSITPH